MKLEQLKELLGDHAKDIKLNLQAVLTPEGAPDLTQQQIDFVALSCSYALKNALLIQLMEGKIQDQFSHAEITAAKAAATIMAMNNVYYRFVHLVDDSRFTTLPAKLRMNIITNPGIDKVVFELACLAISALNGCGMCIQAHTNALLKVGVSQLGIQSAVRIAAVLNAVMIF